VQSAYLLVTHGSRDPRPAHAIADLAEIVQQKLHTRVGTAVLECSELPLHEQIQQFSQGIDQLHIVPLFLLAGVHVMEDIPEQIAIAQQSVSCSITRMPHLGSSPKFRRLLAKRFPIGARVLLSHGSRRAHANRPIEELADQLGAIATYWSVEPKLERQIRMLAEQGHHQIAILPHFLFSGGITDAIALSVQQLREQFPQTQLELLSPLDASVELANLVVDFIRESAPLPDLVM
jgi:sirohydrochlorin cobaltochelatase